MAGSPDGKQAQPRQTARLLKEKQLPTTPMRFQGMFSFPFLPLPTGRDSRKEGSAASGQGGPSHAGGVGAWWGEPVTVLGWFGLKSLVSSCVTVLCLNAWEVVVVVVDFPQAESAKVGRAWLEV